MVSNIVLYVFYVALTATGTEPKATMSALYLVGMLQSFVVNRRWAFGHSGSASAAFLRYFAAYGVGYVVNLCILVVLSDIAGLDHRVVQAAAIGVVAILLFVMQRRWVFRPVGAD